ncbi:MAG TPA: TIGR00730 family Rossman fold protein [Fimbriimonas sp.]
MKCLAVFCGSNPGRRPVYLKAARQVGAVLARRSVRIVTGGGRIGMMGAVADAALAAGGEVVGIIPKHLVEWEVAHGGLTELRVVETMHQRKAMMAEMSDGFLALPGGYGTFEEFCEVLTWSQLGLHPKPCALLNVAGFYDPLTQLFDHAVLEGFVRQEHRALVLQSELIEPLLDQLEAFRPVSVAKWREEYRRPPQSPMSE